MAELNLQNIRDFVERRLEGTDCFLVKAQIGKTDVVVEIDSDTRVDIDFVAALSQQIEAEFAPAIDDYNLEVGSVGLTSPLTLPRQFRKNIGNDVEVLTRDGRKLHGMLRQADEQGFTLSTQEKVRAEGEKKPHLETVEHVFAYPDVKSVVYEIKF